MTVSRAFSTVGDCTAIVNSSQRYTCIDHLQGQEAVYVYRASPTPAAPRRGGASPVARFIVISVAT